MSLVLKYVDQAHNIRMINLLKHIDFLHEGLSVILRHGLLRHDFDCEPFLRLPVFAFLHTRERPASNCFANLVSVLDVTVPVAA